MLARGSDDSAAWHRLALALVLLTVAPLNAWLLASGPRHYWFLLDDFDVFNHLQGFAQGRSPFFYPGLLDGIKGTRELFRYPFYFGLASLFGFAYAPFLVATTALRLLAGWLAFRLLRRLGLSAPGAAAATLLYLFNASSIRSCFWMSPAAKVFCDNFLFAHLLLLARLVEQPDRRQPRALWIGLVATEVAALLAHEHAIVLLGYQLAVAAIAAPSSLRARRVQAFGLASAAMVAALAAYVGYRSLTTANNAYGGLPFLARNARNYVAFLDGKPELGAVLLAVGLGGLARARFALRFGAFGLFWAAASFVPYALARDSNDYYCQIGMLGVGVLLGAAIDVVLDPGGGARPSPVRRLAGLSLALALLASEQSALLARYQSVNDVVAGGLRGRRTLAAIAEAAAIPPEELAERLRHPFRPWPIRDRATPLLALD